MIKIKIKVQGTFLGKLKNVSQCIETDSIDEGDLNKTLTMLLDSLRFQGFPLGRGVSKLAVSEFERVNLTSRYTKVYETKGQLADVVVYCKKM